jgi:hypothetical protein
MKSLNFAFTTYSWLWDNRLEVGKILLLVLSSIVAYQFISNDLLSILIYCLGIWLASSSMIQLHRFILLEKEKSSVKLLVKPTKLDVIYFFAWLVVFMGERIFERVINNIGGYSGSLEIFVILLSIPLTIYIFGRLYMVFPAISVGKNLPFAWNLTNKKERVWLTLSSTIIFVIPMYIFIFLVLMVEAPPYLIWASTFVNVFFTNAHYSHLFKSFTVRRDK